AGMIDNTDYNIGKLIQYLKDIGKYDNTLIIFTSDNGSSEPIEMKFLGLGGVTAEEAEEFYNKFNNTVENMGNSDSFENYGLWGTAPSVAPLSFSKITQGEGGIKPPFIIKEPNVTNNNTDTEIVKAFVHVTDITPTILEYAGVEQAGSSYNGKEVHPISEIYETSLGKFN
ncbi:MAG: sulfatase-like hydrolase/transferase, partial [Nitrososphaeraceae archaeon]